MHRFSRSAVGVLFATLAIAACLRPAAARCSQTTLNAIVAQVSRAEDLLKESPTVAKPELEDADGDLRRCMGTSSQSSGWFITLAHERIALDFAIATAAEGSYSEARDMLRRSQARLAKLDAQVPRSSPVHEFLVSLHHVAASFDADVHHAQALSSMTVSSGRAALVPGTHRARRAKEPAAEDASRQICERPNVPTTVISAQEPDMPAMAQQQGISGTVNVIVSLDEHSEIVATKIQSSASVLLNSAAQAAARQSTFQTEIRNCKPVPSDYVFSVEFSSR